MRTERRNTESDFPNKGSIGGRRDRGISNWFRKPVVLRDMSAAAVFTGFFRNCLYNRRQVASPYCPFFISIRCSLCHNVGNPLPGMQTQSWGPTARRIVRQIPIISGQAKQEGGAFVHFLVRSFGYILHRTTVSAIMSLIHNLARPKTESE